MTSAAYATSERKLLSVKGVKGEGTKVKFTFKAAHSSDEVVTLAKSSNCVPGEVA